MEHGSAGHAPAPPRIASEILGDRLPLAMGYAELLATTGIEHGLIGPRETPRLWDRHILNCAVLEILLPHRSRVIDIGSGAGLPGLVLAIARPDLQITLVEPMKRRTGWLEKAVDELGLLQVSVLRGRAEDYAGRLQAPVVTARALARLDQLCRLSWPLLPVGGRLLALKGRTAPGELERDLPRMRRLGVASAEVVETGVDVIEPPSRVISVVRAEAPRSARRRRDQPRGPAGGAAGGRTRTTRRSA